MGWLSGWRYRRPIVIEGSSAGSTTNYQIPIVVRFGHGSSSGNEIYLGGEIEYFKISIPNSVHNDYGLGYPVTYVFNIPSGVSGIKVLKRHSTSESWTQLEEKTSNDFFNGIECVRFDYENNKAYVSVAFSDNSDEIHIKFVDSNGNNISSYCSFDRIAKYYDNRKCVVVFTADDWNDDNNDVFKTACDITRERHIWFTPGLITGQISSSTWNDIQQKLDAGYLEVASHSRTHPDVPYDDYDSEVGGSKQDIINNLTLPDIYRKGNKQYVWAWIEPYGQSDATVRAKLGEYKYLCDRDITTDNDFAPWDDTNGLYERIGYTIRMGTDGTTDLTELNNAFDSVYAEGKIYHLMCHPVKVDWSSGSYATQHLDYISNRKDVWYVGFGALYAYHFVQERGLVTVTPVYEASKSRPDFGDIRFTDSDGVTELSYWIQEKRDGDYAIFWVKVPDIPTYPNTKTIYIYYGNTSATTTSNGDDTFLFFDDFLGDSLDTSKWIVREGDVSVANSQLILTGTSGTRGLIDGQISFGSGVAIHTKVKCSTTDAENNHICSIRKPNDWNYRAGDLYIYAPNAVKFLVADAGAISDSGEINVSSLDSWHIYKVTWKQGESRAYQDDTPLATHTTNVPTEDMVVVFYEGTTGEVYVDWVFVRKYIDPEPSVSVGEEEVTEETGVFVTNEDAYHGNYSCKFIVIANSGEGEKYVGIKQSQDLTGFNKIKFALKITELTGHCAFEVWSDNDKLDEYTNTTPDWEEKEVDVSSIDGTHEIKFIARAKNYTEDRKIVAYLDKVVKTT